MAVATLSTVIFAVIFTPVVYLLFSFITYLKDVYMSAMSVRQWPGPKPLHWIYGNIHKHPGFAGKTDDNKDTLGNDVMKWFLDMLSQYPRGFYFFASPITPLFQVNHPACAKPLLKSSEPSKPLSGAGYNLVMPWLGEGLLIAKGKTWRRNRHLLTPGFHFEILKPYMVVYNRATDVLLDKMRTCAKSGESFKVVKNISQCTLDILLQCAFSQQSDCQKDGDNNPYVAAVKRMSIELMERFFNPLLYSNFVYLNLTSRGRAHKKDCDYVHKVAEDVIYQRRKQIDEKKQKTEDDGSPNRKYLDFLDILISARDDEGNGLTDVEIRREVDTFLFAGHDTTASALSWTLYAFAKYPKYQRKVQKELDEIFEEKGSDNVEWEDLSKLKYLTLCMKESLRVNPPVTIISRWLENDMEIDGRVLKAGIQADVHIYALHHHPDFWDKPQEFIPERFLPENTQNRDPYCYVPFAAGPRNCIGQTFAMNEDKVVLSRILYNFDIELDPDHEVNYGMELINKPANDIKLKLKLRR